MSLPITPIAAPVLIDPAQIILDGSPKASFGEVLASTVKEVETANSTADAAAQNFISGGTQDLHSTILAGQSADLDFELFMQVRNKVVSAYEEIMKMQV